MFAVSPTYAQMDTLFVVVLVVEQAEQQQKRRRRQTRFWVAQHRRLAEAGPGFAGLPKAESNAATLSRGGCLEIACSPPPALFLRLASLPRSDFLSR